MPAMPPKKRASIVTNGPNSYMIAPSSVATHCAFLRISIPTSLLNSLNLLKMDRPRHQIEDFE